MLRPTALAALAALLAVPFIAAAPAAQAASPTTVWIEDGTLRIAAPRGQNNDLVILPRTGPAGALVDVTDQANLLAAQFPCVTTNQGHGVTCKADLILGLRVDTGDGNDRISNGLGVLGLGTGRAATILAGPGDDTVFDVHGNTRIDAGEGADTVTAGLGSDLVIGGPGIDVMNYSDHSAAVTVKLDNVGTDGVNQEFDDIRSDVENLAGTFLSDVLIGSAANNTLYGGGGNDILRGEGGNDRLQGGAGDDGVDGGPGTDVMSYEDHGSRVVVTLNHPSCDGSPGIDCDNVAASVENLIGGSGNDDLVGTDAANYIRGGPGDDFLNGLGGNDQLHGDGGNDSVIGGSGTDTCVGELNDCP